MKGSGILAVAAFAVATMAMYGTAEARIGGGKSFGAQRPSVTPRASAPPAATPPAAASQPVMPAQPGAALPAKPAAAAAPAPSGASRWLGPIAGLAAGLGLAALLSHFGLPEGMESFLLIALLVVGAVLALRFFFARRTQTQQPLAYAGARGPGAAAATFATSPAPEWGGAPRIEPVLGAAAVATVPEKLLPPGFDAEGFVKHAKLQFVRLQAAHDAGDREALRDVLTPEMLAEVMRDLDSGTTRVATDVVSLDAAVLEVATEGDHHWASVRFTGTLREGGAAAPAAFDEVWNLSKPVDGKSGWLLAGIQQLA
jgi:predicted lipid-binding transport protein (Tim44 family)